jgi:hypothetical protein
MLVGKDATVDSNFENPIPRYTVQYCKIFKISYVNTEYQFWSRFYSIKKLQYFPLFVGIKTWNTVPTNWDGLKNPDLT